MNDTQAGKRESRRKWKWLPTIDDRHKVDCKIISRIQSFMQSLDQPNFMTLRNLLHNVIWVVSLVCLGDAHYNSLGVGTGQY